MEFRVLVPCMVEGSADIGFVRTAKQAIASASRLRYDIAHEMTHKQLILSGKNDTGMSAAFAVLKQLAATPLEKGILAVSPYGLSPWSALEQRAGCIFRRLPESPIKLAFRDDALQRVNRALLRLLDGILTALCLTLILVLAALARLPDGLTFALVMLAACLRYGHRDEPGDHACLSRHRYRKSTGSSSQE